LLVGKMPYPELKARALNRLNIADHLLSTTYTIVKDPKLLVSVIENLLQALQHAIDAIIDFEQSFHDIKHDQKLDIFRRKIITKYSFDPKILDFLSELKEIIESHKKSGVEFTKKEKFIISDNNYNLKTLTLEDAKSKYVKTKHYITEILKIISKYD